MNCNLLGLDPNAWLAIAAFAYAGATYWLARATSRGSSEVARAARDVAHQQNLVQSANIAEQLKSAELGLSRQLEANAAGVTAQIAASVDAQTRQIRANAEDVAAQIAASSDAQTRQIEAMRDAALIQARASSVSNNRQAWINSLRDEVTGFLTDAELRSVVNDEMRPSEERENQQLRIRRALAAHIFKVRLLLNPTEGESTTLLGMLQDVELSGLTDESREMIVAHTQTILKTEWERVKSGE